MTTDHGPTETSIRIPLRFRDMDMLGHLNQAVYHELLEDGRGALLEAVRAPGTFDFVLARVELNYRREVRHAHGYVDIRARVARVGSKSITIDHDIVLPDGTPAATGSSVLVAWNPEDRAARLLSPEERAALKA
jgi:acyl-CoA thioester hydrolase